MLNFIKWIFELFSKWLKQLFDLFKKLQFYYLCLFVFIYYPIHYFFPLTIEPIIQAVKLFLDDSPNEIKQICDNVTYPVTREILIWECQKAVKNRDYKKLQDLAKKGVPSAAAEYGMYLRGEGDYENGYRFILEAEKNGSPLGRYLLGQAHILGEAYLEGISQPKDSKKGLELIGMAANDGNWDARVFLKTHKYSPKVQPVATK